MRNRPKTITQTNEKLTQEVVVDLAVRIVAERGVFEEEAPGMRKSGRMLPEERRSHRSSKQEKQEPSRKTLGTSPGRRS